MEKQCELCLKITHPPVNQMRHRVVCLDCAVEVYRGMENEDGANVAKVADGDGDWWSFSDFSLNGKFASQVSKMLTEICPQCRKRH